MREFTIEDYFEILDGRSNAFAQAEAIRSILEKENISFNKLIDGLSFYKYKYSFMDNEIPLFKREILITSLEKLQSFTKVKSTHLTLIIETNRFLFEDNYLLIKKEINRLIDKHSVDFEKGKLKIEIEELKQGSLDVKIVIAGIAIIFNICKAIKLISKMVDDLRYQRLNSREKNKFIVESAIILLEVVSLFLTSVGGNNCHVDDLPLDITTISLLLNILYEWLDSKGE